MIDPRVRSQLLRFGIIGSMSIAAGANAETVTLAPAKDTTMIQDSAGSRGNGQGGGVFSGRTGLTGGEPRILRALLAFDVAAAVPEGSTITGVSLTLYTLSSVSGPLDHQLHRTLANWGEGASSGPGGVGDDAQPGDATWLHRFYPDVFWTTPGGEYVAGPSASASISGAGEFVTWASSAMVADVQQWLDDSKSNFGWTLIGNEGSLNTAKKLASRQWDPIDERPRLVIEFTPPVPCPADVTGNQVIDIDDLLTVINSWGSGPGPADVTGNGVVDIDDLLAVINSWGPC